MCESVEIAEILSACLSHFCGKNFVKTVVLLNKLLNQIVDLTIFFQWENFSFYKLCHINVEKWKLYFCQKYFVK